jgi:hypothetical protein
VGATPPTVHPGLASVLSARTDFESPVSTTGAYEWAVRIEAALREAAAAVNGGPCQVRFEWDDAAGRVELDEESG